MEDILENPRNFSCLFSTSHIRVHLKNAILVACSSSSTTVRYNKCSSMAVTETATAPFSLSYFNKVQKLAQFYHSKNGTLKNSFLINAMYRKYNQIKVKLKAQWIRTRTFSITNYAKIIYKKNVFGGIQIVNNRIRTRDL